MARDIQERIKKLIIDQRLPSGASLPTEPELMERLGVSRNSVREALKALQAMGIVEIRHGFGTYVGPMSMAPMIEGLTFRTVAGHYRGEDSLLQLLELREAVETGLIARLAGRIPAADLAELDALVDRMDTEAAATGGTASRGWSTPKPTEHFTPLSTAVCAIRCSARSWRLSGTLSTRCARIWWTSRRTPRSPAVSTGRSSTRSDPAMYSGPSGRYGNTSVIFERG
jgi:DNA-binding transcriptional MocR family regulator